MATIKEIRSRLIRKGIKNKLPTKKSDLEKLLKDVESGKITKKSWNEQTKKSPSLDYKKSKYYKLSVPDMKDELKAKGIVNGLPRTKPGLVAFLEADKCNPLEGVFCKDSNNVCDVRNNICIDPSYVKGKVKITKFGTHKIGGQVDNVNEIVTILGNKKGSEKEVDKEEIITPITKEFINQKDLTIILKKIFSKTKPVFGDHISNKVESEINFFLEN